MIERLEVTPGTGTVIRYGGIVAWADVAASSALISFLAQSARNLGPSPRGGRQIADHIAGVLGARDPEPHVAFAVIGPSDHGWASLLHGPVQAWDGARWLAPTPSPGWLQAIITPRPAITVGAAGVPAPPVQPDGMWDLEAGVVPGAGFVLTPGAEPARLAVVPAANIDTVPPPAVPPAEVAATTALAAVPPTLMVSAVAAEREAERLGHDDSPRPLDADSSGAGEPEAEPLPVVVGVAAAVATTDTGAEVKGEQEPDREPELAEPELAESELAESELAEPELAEPEPPKPEAMVRRPVAPGPAGSLDLRAVRTAAGPPLPRGDGPNERIPGAPVVAGVLCSRGHLNRPGLLACARCHTRIPAGAREQVSGTRPPLGVLVADDGAIYRLDRNYLVGSNSTRDPTVGGGLARPLVLTGSDISGSHAELRLTDWDLTVVDRGSATGTSIYEPGATEWARLRPYEPRVVSPGTHMAFGQRVVTYLSPWVPSA